MSCVKCLLLTWIWLLLCVGYIVAYTPFRLTDCSNNPNDVVRFSGVYIHHYPITIPGDVRVSADVHVLRPMTGGVRLYVKVEKYVLYDYFEMPCISGVGSCDYDLCWLLDHHHGHRRCPWQLRISDNFPCLCPFQNGTHTLQPYPFSIPSVHASWQWITAGDFRVTGRLTNTTTNEEIGCYRAEFTTQARPSEDDGFFSFFNW